jgi:glycosyltransferase involved in cell wall biosynthesis
MPRAEIAMLSSNTNAQFFIEVSTLFEPYWTGLANVTAKLARYFLETKPKDTFFFVGTDTILPEYIRTAVNEAPGGYLNCFVKSGFAVGQNLHSALKRCELSVAIFPNIKPFHRVFDVELLIAHDLSALLMPELHREQAASIHAAALSRDVFTSDLICCVSHATKDDVSRYLRVPEERLFVSHLGVEIPVALDGRLDSARMREYAIILGTIEPRKNMRLVAEFMRSMPESWEDLFVFFVGSMGWGQPFEEIFADPLRSPLGERILFTGYVPEALKQALLARAKFAVYPSLFEGFGLPILEAMAAGCPIIASKSSSMMELGLDTEFYFDPTSVADFSRAFELVNALDLQERDRLSKRLRAKASKFTWEGFGDRVVAGIENYVTSRVKFASGMR